MTKLMSTAVRCVVSKHIHQPNEGFRKIRKTVSILAVQDRPDLRYKSSNLCLKAQIASQIEWEEGEVPVTK